MEAMHEHRRRQLSQRGLHVQITFRDFLRFACFAFNVLRASRSRVALLLLGFRTEYVALAAMEFMQT